VPVETFNFINSLDATNPPTSDGLVGGDDHIRGIKATLKATFPNITGAVNSTQAQIDAIAALLVAGVLRANGAAFPGMIADHGCTTPPTGWLVCDGQAVSRTTYADLYNAIGTTWGAGDGSTPFNVPGLQSRFRRHRDNNPALAGGVGTKQSPCNLAHTHTGGGTTGAADRSLDHLHTGTTGFMDRNNPHTHSETSLGLTTTGGGSFAAGGPAVGGTTGATDINHAHAFTTNGADRSIDHLHAFSFTTSLGSADYANEARPYSATVLTCIKV